MTKDDKRISFTLRVKRDLSDQINIKAKQEGLTKNAYITNVLLSCLKNEN